MLHATTIIPAPSNHNLPMPSVDLARAARRSYATPSEWSPDDIARAVLRYRRFLGLKLCSPKARLAPTHDIDVIWHLHMLSPRAYYEDCQRLFGRILDHDGGFGRDPEELPQLIACHRATAALWERVYGEAYALPRPGADEQATNCWHDCQDRCWHACKDGISAVD